MPKPEIFPKKSGVGICDLESMSVVWRVSVVWWYVSSLKGNNVSSLKHMLVVLSLCQWT